MSERLGSAASRRTRLAFSARSSAAGWGARIARAADLRLGQVTISDDNRLGLTQQERRVVRVRFHEPLDDACAPS